MRIQLLSPLLVNQIAAGEVVERPAAVIKECLENSIDAGATAINVSVMRGGLKQMIITDNGCGIHREDLPLAVKSHATSKIAQLDDLAEIHSLGFRGEALASISAVSKFRLISREKSSEQAFEIQEGIVKPAAHSIGTTVEINELFYNTPARRKFLRSEKTEFLQIDAVVRKIALSRFDIAIRFLHDEKEIFSLQPALTFEQQEKRVQKILSKAFLDHAKYLDVTVDDLRLRGWIANPEFLRSSNDFQYCYLNGRMIRDKLIQHAIKQAVEGQLFPGRQPAYCLFLECDPKTVDVNVHPTKHEVRFQQARWVHDFVYSQCKSALKVNVPELPRLKVSATPVHYQTSLIAESEFGRVLGVAQDRYCFSESETSFFIVDLLSAERELLLEHCKSYEILPNRPLLIPVKVTHPKNSAFGMLGIEWDALSDTTAVVRSIPIALPQLNIQTFFSAINSESRSREQWLKLLIEHTDLLVALRKPELILNELSQINWREKSAWGSRIVKITPIHQLETLLDE